ncbi:MAG: ferredoxin [Patescibacteria group bacterium]|jgi:ferredoxin
MPTPKKTNPSGPTMVGDWKVTVDRKLCIGAATCVAIAEKTFALDSEAKAVILDTAINDAKEVILDAAMACPVAAIIIEDSKGKRIFPK